MKKTNVLITVFISIVLLVVAVVVLACTVFIVRNIEVQGNVVSEYISEEKVAQSSGVSVGDSIITINKNKIMASIEKANPYVKVLSVSREFPNTLIVKATERTPILAIPLAEGGKYAVCDVELKVLSLAEATSFTVVKGIAVPVPEEGEDALVGTYLSVAEIANLVTVRSVAEASKQDVLELSGASFYTFFRSIEIVPKTDYIYAFITTNTGVSFVIDTSLSTDVYTQLSMCKLYYDSDEVAKSKTDGYIALDKNSLLVAYKWLENIE